MTERIVCIGNYCKLRNVQPQYHSFASCAQCHYSNMLKETMCNKDEEDIKAVRYL